MLEPNCQAARLTCKHGEPYIVVSLRHAQRMCVPVGNNAALLAQAAQYLTLHPT